MPIVKIELVGKYEAAKKQALCDFVADQICSHTATFPKNIYVYINEWDRENVRKTAPVVMITWTAMPETRTHEAKQAIMLAMTDYLAEMTGENRSEIVVLISEVPLKDAMLGGINRYDNPNW